jgi:exo-1,4-beta-D-glucosaminidase
MSIAGGDSPVKIVFLTLEDSHGRIVARNEYCLAEVMDKHDWSKYRWWRTELESYADFSALNDLSPAEVQATVTRKGDKLDVTLSNKAEVPAFFIRMALKDASGEYIVPAYWNDNLVSLEPGQTLTFSCRCGQDKEILDGATVTVEGWNVAGSVIEL